MQLRIVLHYLCLVSKIKYVYVQNDSDVAIENKTGSSSTPSTSTIALTSTVASTTPLDLTQKDEAKIRKPVKIPPADKLVNVLSPINVMSTDVPKFNDYASQFSTLYDMKCGGSVTALVGRTESGRVIVCKKGSDNALCDLKSIRMWLPYSKKLIQQDSESTVKDAKLKVEVGEIVITLDPGCRLIFAKEHALRHRFQNKPETIRQVLEKYPGFYLQPTIYHPRKKYYTGNQLSLGGNLHKGVRTKKSIKCKAGCDLGQLFYYEMPPNFLIFSLIYVDGSKCEWMKICSRGALGVGWDNFLCNDVDIINVYIRHGFVTMPFAQNGAPIRFLKATEGTHPLEEMKSRPTQIGFDFDGERFSIWSVGRERVTSSKSVNHDGHIILYFSHHDCLLKDYGIKYMGENNGIVYQIDDSKSIDGVTVKDMEYIKYATAQSKASLETLATDETTPDPLAVAPVTTTPPRSHKMFKGEAVGTVRAKPRTGWMIWMIFYGFCLGSISSLLIAGSLLYLARRIAYVDWYRGMYSRYGCDASGITGGVTGEAFGNTTVGGGTTMGATGTSMMGTTGGTSTMGTPGGTSTMGGTTATSMMGTTAGATSSVGGVESGSTSRTSAGDMVTM
ncbi:hypothetical protein DICVIV_02224 [Dictyocaulus viviparus]|uniref:Uncharacterized protein n=1 Tax=Dictyocaulus viviparus TaxID=29172 RepID=A0A0D8YAG9_DICVI|nr:hypothetical protein DICVIV_02224 [Dictyocaulus viviparus]